MLDISREKILNFIYDGENSFIEFKRDKIQNHALAS